MTRWEFYVQLPFRQKFFCKTSGKQNLIGMIHFKASSHIQNRFFFLTFRLAASSEPQGETLGKKNDFQLQKTKLYWNIQHVALFNGCIARLGRSSWKATDAINHIVLPRYIGPPTTDPCAYSLLCFCDAAGKAYAATVYLQYTQHGQHYQPRILFLARPGWHPPNQSRFLAWSSWQLFLEFAVFDLFEHSCICPLNDKIAVEWLSMCFRMATITSVKTATIHRQLPTVNLFSSYHRPLCDVVWKPSRPSFTGCVSISSCQWRSVVAWTWLAFSPSKWLANVGYWESSLARREFRPKQEVCSLWNEARHSWCWPSAWWSGGKSCSRLSVIKSLVFFAAVTYHWMGPTLP